MAMKIGAFIDADNISASMAEQAIHKLRGSGDIQLIHAYGNWTRKSSIWKNLANNYGVIINHRYNITRSKNAADISLAVDATAMLYGKMQFDTLAIISSDSDFVPLIQHAQACGKIAIGLGGNKSHETYVGQCDKFIFLEEKKVVNLNAANRK